MMANYWLFDWIVDKGDCYVHRYEVPDVMEFHDSDGDPLDLEPSSLQFFYKKRTAKKPDLLSGIHSFPIISERFKDLLVNQAVSDLEFHAIRLICEASGEIDQGYFFLNILNNRSCFDRQGSKYNVPDYDPNEIAEVSHLAIHEAPLAGRDLVRMAEIPSLILVSTRLKDLIEAHRLTGIICEPLDSYECW